MATPSKRSHDAAAFDDDRSDATQSDEPAPKRSRHQSSKKRSHQNSHIDPTWGQKYVFFNQDAETSVPHDSDIECEDDSDAMAYLKSVRLEAANIPRLLVAPKRQIGPQLPQGFELARPGMVGEDNGDLNGDAQQAQGEEPEEGHEDHSMYTSGAGDFRGRYEDGAYIAQPDDRHDNGAHRNERFREEDEDGQLDEYGERWYYDDDSDDEAQAHRHHDHYDHHAYDSHYRHRDGQQAEADLREAYFSSLQEQYVSLRTVLQSKPPPDAVASLPRTHGYNAAPFGPRTSVFTVWNQRLRNTDPLPAQVASMDREAVLRVIRVLLSGKFLRRGCELRERTSRWLWALLARLPDRGEMNHVEVGWVRDLGRRAVLMSRSLVEMADLREALDGEGADLGDEEEDEDEDGNGVRDVIVEGEDEGRRDEREKNEGAEESDPSRETATRVETAVERTEPVPLEEVRGETGDGEAKDSDGRDDDDKSEPMDCSEDGEIAEDDGEGPESLEAARARVLAQLDDADDPAKTQGAQDEPDASDPIADAQMRARVNMRATLNMILTVAGEFYGQRDLLEFREPFTGM